MRYFRLKIARFSSALLLAVVCSSCAGQGFFGGGTATAPEAKAPDAELISQESPVQLPNKADQVLDVRLDDSPEVTLVRMTGNAPLQDCQFRRSGDRQFVLELNDVKPGAGLGSLPLVSERVTLAHGGTTPPNAIQLVGTLKKPLDHYMLDAVGNELILALYLSKETPVVKKKKASSSRTASKSSRKGDAKASGKTASKTASKKSASKASSKTASKTSTKSDTETKPTPPRLTLAKSASDRALAERGRSVSVAGTGDTGGTQSAAATATATRATDEIVRKEYLGKPISLDLLDADLKNVLRLLSDISGTNMLVEPDVSGRVTIKVEKVPWDQVLDMILAMNDLGKEQVGNVIRIARQGKLKQEWTQQVEGIKAKQELLEAAKDVGAITTAYLTINYAQPVEIAAKISEIKSARGKVSVDDRSSLVIYTDYPGRIEAAKGLLARLDRATAQVLIEARIVTANRDLTTSLGTDWSLRFQKRNLPLLTDTPAEGTRTYQVNQPTQPLLGITIADVIGDTLYSLDFKLSALETSSQINIVAAPKVLTINNVKAVISQGTQIPYLVRSDYGSSSTQFKDAVIELQVTPHITPDQKVRLEIQAKQDEPTAKNYQVGDSSVPGIDTRKINTELLVDDGKVIVIGGVMRGREEESTTGTPALNKIPILGWLFKTETTSNTKTELLIFISPQIVEPTGMPART